MLPYNTIPPDLRDEDGYYQMNSGQIQVFPFAVTPGGSTDIIMLHNQDYAQDFSLRCWFSITADGSILFPALQAGFPMPRSERVITIWDDSLAPPRRDDDEEIADQRLFHPASQPIYFNVQNLQNSTNSYRLTFSPPT